ncbi:MAG: glutamate 5-kinase [Candidatus Alcyoniella australis]|nr:glutamate 5-kinase [Candidatus Alcyoniella australis]
MTLDRRELMSQTRTVVIKVGSGVLADADNSGLSMARVAELARDVQGVRSRNVRVVLVSSGAILAGRGRLGLNAGPCSLAETQAAAAVGQSALMQAYERYFATWNGKVAQVLLTGSGLSARARFNNARQTLRVLIERGFVPIINENDTVATEEITCGDNDKLAALVVNLVEADLLVMLSVEQGIFDADPRGGDAKLLPLIRDIDELAKRVGEPKPSMTGRGGIASKVASAKIVARYGVPTVVAHGREPDVLRRLFDGEDLGTLVLPATEQLGSRKHWIAFGSRPNGALVIDQGAASALRRGGTSLLPRGVIEVRGSFKAGELIAIVEQCGTEVGRGVANYSGEQCAKVMGHAGSEIEALLGVSGADELVHVDNMVLSDPIEDRPNGV